MKRSFPAWAGVWLAAVLALPAVVPHAIANGYPAKPVRMVIPFAPGSATDTAGRIIAQELSQSLGQNVIVENRAGANGQIAAAHVARSAADGYTLFMTTNSTHSANPHLYRRLHYDPLHDFEPVARLGTLPFMLVVHPSVPVSDTASFLDYARAHPGELFYGTASTASLIGAETINVLAGTELVRVYYSSSQQAMGDLVAGRLQVMVADFTTAMPQVKAGRIKVLAVTTAKRSVLVPDAPSIGEALDGFEMTSWNGVFVPAGTPKPVIDRLAQAMLELLAKPQVERSLAVAGFEVDPMETVPFARYVREQLEYWGRLVRAAGIPPE
ncbi:MAG: tripartite tricarboxylate transporter substrate binding protein [Burkholderiales bacterium]